MANQYQPVTAEKQKHIAVLVAKGLSDRTIARKVGVHHTTVLRYRQDPARSTVCAGPEQIKQGIRAALKRGDLSARALAERIGVSASALRRAVADLQRAGVLITELPGGILSLASTASLEGGKHEVRGTAGEWTHHFGLTSDNHLCNVHARLDVLKAAYDRFERRGITTVFNAGNWIDGEAKFNKNELLTAPGMDNQIDYWIENWPVRKGITTFFIAGDDHEGWYAQREGIEIGRYAQMRAEKAGRQDLKYIGYVECDIALRRGQSKPSVMRVMHPGGGSAYATSYTAQKIVESYQGGEKPQVLILGHYHKAEYGYPREVHCVQAGCTTDQSLFMRKKRLAAHVGFWELQILQDDAGVITGFTPRFFPFFDRGYYEKRFR